MFRLGVNTNANGQLNSSIFGPSKQGQQSITGQLFIQVPVDGGSAHVLEFSVVHFDGPNRGFLIFVRVIDLTSDDFESLDSVQPDFLGSEEYFRKEVLHLEHF
jgi:hypothetical protein